MSHLLAADIGMRRTGLAFADTKAGFIMALDTVQHSTESELMSAITRVVKERHIVEIIIGLPLLPQGKAGEQAVYIQNISALIEEKVGVPVTFIDERYTTPNIQEFDKDASAACAILTIALDQRAEAKKIH
jgi:putative Holliday junction resolvase